jgi:hypothetical protein
MKSEAKAADKICTFSMSIANLPYSDSNPLRNSLCSSLFSPQLRAKINYYMKVEAKQEEGKSKIKREKQDQIEVAKAHSSKSDSKYNTDVEVIKKIAPP